MSNTVGPGPSQLPPVHVRRQGRVCTVFLDLAAGEVPLPLSSAEDAPPGGFPFTGPVEAIAAKFAGRQLIFHDPKHPPQPTTPPLSAAQEAEIARILKQPGAPAQGTIQVAPPLAAAEDPRLQVLQAQTAVVEDLKRHVLREFEGFVREALQTEAGKADAEAVGSFLLSAFPELEDGLRAAAEAAKGSKARRRFTL